MTITQLNKKAIAVTGLPEGAYEFEICTNINTGLKFMVYDGKANTPYKEQLPAGDWRLLGFADDLLSNQIKSIVDHVKLNDGRGRVYKNYQSVKSDTTEWFPGLTKSLHSLLKAKGLHVSNPLGEKPNRSDFNDMTDNHYADSTYEWRLSKWHSAELLTNPLILIQ